jgi:hypothetical protein
MRFTFTRLRCMSISVVFLLLISLTAPTQAKDSRGFTLPVTLSEPRVTVKMEKTALRTALKKVLGAARLDFSLHPDIPYNDVTIDMQDQPLSVVLKALFKFSNRPLQCRIKDNVYYIEPASAPTAKPEPQPRAGFGNRQGAVGLDAMPQRTNPPFAPPDPQVSIDGNTKPLRDVIGEVFHKAKANFLIHPDVPLDPVTVYMKQPLSVVLKSLFKLSSKPLRYRIWNDVYQVEPLPNADAKPGQFDGSGDMRVIMGLTKVPARTAIILIMDQFQQSYSISPKLNQILKDTPVTIQMSISFERALDTLRRSTGVEFQIVPEGKRIHFLLPGEKIEPRPFIKGGAAAPGEKHVTVDWEGNVALGSALRLLMRQFKAEYDLHPDLSAATISLRMENVPLSQALTEIGKASSIPFTVRLEKGVYRLIPVKGAGDTNKAP